MNGLQIRWKEVQVLIRGEAGSKTVFVETSQRFMVSCFEKDSEKEVAKTPFGLISKSAPMACGTYGIVVPSKGFKRNFSFKVILILLLYS